jgi:hypothetical protein
VDLSCILPVDCSQRNINESLPLVSKYYKRTFILSIIHAIQLFQLRLSTRKAEKSNASAKSCWESLKK